MDEQLRLGLRVPGGRRSIPEHRRRSPAGRYRFGATKERDAAERMRRLGYTPVRSAGSRGAADVLGLNAHGEALAVQVKAGRRQPAPGEIADALGELMSAFPAARCELWWWDSTRRTWHRYAEAENV